MELASSDMGGTEPDEKGEAQVREPPAETTAKRRVGFGSAVSAVVDLLATAPSSATYAPRIMSFLSGLPNHGAGSLRPRSTNGADGRRLKSTPGLKPTTPFYRNLGQCCAERGICADLWIISHKGTDLGSLKPLCTLSGGVLHVYEPVAKEGWAAVPQDIFNALSRKRAMQGMLRLRTSEQFSTTRAFGHLTPDSQYDNLYHITACDEDASFAFDLDFADATTFDSAAGDGGSDDDSSKTITHLPRIQMAFCYCARLHKSAPSSAGGSGGQEWHPAPLVKRLRVQTVEFDVARTPADMYSGVVPEVVLKLLVHKVAIAMEKEGIEAGGEVLLKQWVARLCESYRKHMKIGAEVSADGLLNMAPQLGVLCRYVYGLIKSPMVRVQDTSMDWRVYKQTLWSRLQPLELATAVYPRLMPFASASRPGIASERLIALSMQSVTDYAGQHAGAAVTATGEEACAYFVLDAHTEIVVFTPIQPAYPTPDGGAWPPARQAIASPCILHTPACATALCS